MSVRTDPCSRGWSMLSARCLTGSPSRQRLLLPLSGSSGSNRRFEIQLREKPWYNPRVARGLKRAGSKHEMSDELITAAQAAKVMGVHPSVVYYLIDRGELRVVTTPPVGRAKRGKRYLLRAEVERLGDTWRQRAKRAPKGRPLDEGGEAGDGPLPRRKRRCVSRESVV